MFHFSRLVKSQSNRLPSHPLSTLNTHHLVFKWAQSYKGISGTCHPQTVGISTFPTSESHRGSQPWATLTHSQAGGNAAELGQLLGDSVHLNTQFSGGNQHQHTCYWRLAGFVDQTFQDGQGKGSRFTWRTGSRKAMGRASVPSKFRFSPAHTIYTSARGK